MHGQGGVEGRENREARMLDEQGSEEGTCGAMQRPESTRLQISPEVVRNTRGICKRKCSARYWLTHREASVHQSTDRAEDLGPRPRRSDVRDVRRTRRLRCAPTSNESIQEWTEEEEVVAQSRVVVDRSSHRHANQCAPFRRPSRAGRTGGKRRPWRGCRRARGSRPVSDRSGPKRRPSSRLSTRRERPSTSLREVPVGYVPSAKPGKRLVKGRTHQTRDLRLDRATFMALFRPFSVGRDRTSRS